MQRYDVIILGAGAAGLMCAVEAAKRGRRVLLLDHADAIGKKILVSGGGRCNFTNLHCTPENFLSENPHFARSALARYTPADFIAKVEQHNIPYHEKTLGQLFCDRTSRDVVTMLERECIEAAVQIHLKTHIEAVVCSAPRSFTVTTSSGLFTAQSVVIATGGLSIPKMGATGLGYDLARQFNLQLVEPRPGLVPITFSAQDRDRWCSLAGVSTEVTASIGKQTFREKLLITHRGLSGPAILQVSSFWSPGHSVSLDLSPQQNAFASMPRDRTAAIVALRAILPARWAERWLDLNAPPVRTLSNAVLAALEDQLHAWPITPAGTEGYSKAEVTAGGVDTAELNPRTLESRRVPGLFFIGEVVDVTGWLGGYNFQWAWASGFCAGQAA